MEKMIPVLSLVVVALAVFAGPLIALLVAKRQVLSALDIANKQITAPMRQAWINSLRILLAKISSSALHYFIAGFEERTDTEYMRLTYLEHRIHLMLNPFEDDHRQLEKLVRTMVGSLERGKDKDKDFIHAHTALMELSRQVLKREWNVIKKPIKMV